MGFAQDTNIKLDLAELETGFGQELRQKILKQNLYVFLYATIIAGALAAILPTNIPPVIIISGILIYVLLNILALVVCHRGHIKSAAMGYTSSIVCMNTATIFATGSVEMHIIISFVNLILVNGFFVGARGALGVMVVNLLVVTGYLTFAEGADLMSLGESTLPQQAVAMGVSLLSTGFVMASGVRLLQRSAEASAFAISELQSARDSLDERHQRAKELAHLGELVIRTESVNELLQSFVDILQKRPQIRNVFILDRFGEPLRRESESFTALNIDEKFMKEDIQKMTRGLNRYPDEDKQIYWMPLAAQNEPSWILIIEFTPYSFIVDDQELFIGAAAGIIASGLKRFESEQSVRQTQRLETVGKVAGSIAHDFNNMLTSIVGCNELTKQSIGDEHPAQSHLEMSGIAAKQAAALVNKLLTFAHARPTKPEVINLASFIDEQKAFLNNFMHENIDLSFDVDGTDLWILADPVEIEQVFVNLLSNARNAIPTGGTVTVCVKKTETSKVLIEIADSGPGIPSSDRARVFEPFFTTRAKKGGTGLGLPTVKAIVEENQGQMTIGDSLQGGASIKLYWPIAQEPSVEPREASMRPLPALEEANVLVVDDDPLVRATITKLLDVIGLSVVAVDGAPQALRALESDTEFGIVITDFMMPEMSGAELIDEIRKRDKAIPIILMSGYDDYREFTEHSTHLPNSRIQKPITLHQLQKVLRESQSIDL
ncbi:MAG: ATP-binding protein [Myxococcota bacterium]|nr:ATP-binding protein [Myxococcota bacterium]